MDREAADQMFKEGTLTFRDYVRLMGCRFGNISSFVHVEAEDLAYVLAQIDEMKAVHSERYGLYVG